MEEKNIVKISSVTKKGITTYIPLGFGFSIMRLRFWTNK